MAALSRVVRSWRRTKGLGSIVTQIDTLCREYALEDFAVFEGHFTGPHTGKSYYGCPHRRNINL